LTRYQGQQTEHHAELWLKQQGLQLITRNFRCRYGEIDLIMQQQDTLVFVEVRLRRSKDFGGAAASITNAKQQRIIHTAQYYLQQHGLNCPCRFDAVVSDGKQLQWIKNAFSA